ncbi:MAG: DUF1996 domain-containing protein [Novosphingobium sp.]
MRNSVRKGLFLLPLAILCLMGCVQDGNQAASLEIQSSSATETSATPKAADGIIIAPASETGTGGTVTAVAEVDSGLDVPSLLESRPIPPSGAPDVVGAFRFTCGPGQILYDDPIVYPGQPGKSHLHQFFGNLDANANSTYDSLRSHGESTCSSDLNRSAYWMPAMLDGKGNVVRPNWVGIYYKRRPASDPFCTTAAKECVGIPRGLRFIFGFDVTRPDDPQPENKHFSFLCVEGWSPVTDHADFASTARNCHVGQWIKASISSPECWDGVHLDVPDHRSHLSYMKRDESTGWVEKCPSTHPYLIPQFTMGVSYSVVAGDDPTLWYLASDHMVPGAAPGSTFHSDYFEGWEEEIRLRWEAGCIDQLLNCSAGDLGDGQGMRLNSHFPNAANDASATTAPHLVPVPSGGPSSGSSSSSSSTSSSSTSTSGGTSSSGGRTVPSAPGPSALFISSS